MNLYKFNISEDSSYRCELCDINKTIESGGNGRIDIWKKSLNVFRKYPLVGVGFDNFYLAYPNPKVDNTISFIITGNEVIENSNSYYLVDNAHNVYLHLLISTGLLGLIPYLILCLLTFIKGLKQNNKLVFILIQGFVAYSIQAFANISVIEVAPIYYIIMGLILCSTSKSLT